jgi:hypothetical protein
MVKVTSVINFGIEQVKEEMFNFENRPAWDKMCKSARKIREVGEGLHSFLSMKNEK